jgi:pimeloyl-ACP methyl ester carboxylesterase
MQSGFITYNHSTIHFHYGGRGTTPLVCFHGYAESCAHFDFLEKYVEDQFTIIAMDLPFHGQTEWKGKYVLPSDLAAVVKQILEQLNVAGNKMHLLGFSLGGRMALCVLQELSSQVSKLVLLAPDGLKVNFWYWLATQSTVGSGLFKFTMKKPGWFLGMLRVSDKMKLINQSIYKFVEYYIHDDQVRKELYERWTGLSKCTPDAAGIKNIIAQQNIPVVVLYGKFDRIITQQTGRKFLNNVPGAKVQVLNCGHQVLHEKNAKEIADALVKH